MDKRTIGIKELFSIVITSAAELIEVTVQMPLPYARAISKLGNAFEKEVDQFIQPKEDV
jgi:hypothetical protein